MDDAHVWKPGDLVLVSTAALDFVARVHSAEIPAGVGVEILLVAAYGENGERFFFPAPARESRRVSPADLVLLDEAPRPSPVG